MPIGEIREGARVCIYGWGTAIGVHKHLTVSRVTKTMVIVDDGRRYNRQHGHSVPRHDWGGTTISTTCQGKRRDAE